MTSNPEELRARILAESGSFRKLRGRHIITTQGLAYCAFRTPKLVIERSLSRRDAHERLVNFGLTSSEVTGASALDLGCNIGAMLFELTNLGLGSGVGIEFDEKKIALAAEIATLCDWDHLKFEAADIDGLSVDQLGTFDFVFALAIESHVNYPERLYSLLGKVCTKKLYFEGNSRCDQDDVEKRLIENGFGQVKRLGFCTDDSSPEFNNRPMFVADKL